MKTLPLVSLTVSAVATLLVAPNAFGQTATATTTAAAAPMPAPAAAVAGDSDHDAMVGRLAVGYLGRRTMSVGAASQAAFYATVDAPVVGVRFWMDPMVGLDAGLGFGIAGGGGEIEIPGAALAEASDPDVMAFILHAGLPLSLAAADHFSFQVVPELNFGYGTQTEEQPAPEADTDHTGIHVDVGVRAGAEIYFGFIGVPQLSLQGSIGVRVQYENATTDDPDAAGVITTTKRNETMIGTTVYDNPWNIFTSNVAALYYF
jgi:hypothetical protein